MKKHLKTLLVILFMALSLTFFPRQASAEENLEINEWKVEASLETNGDLVISEDITFEFNEKFNGVYREIVLDNIESITGITVAEVDTGSITEYKPAKKADNGDKGVYTVNEKKNKLTIKIYSPSRDEVKTFRIGYTVNNVAVRYNDIGELYYKFIGKENDTPIDRLVIDIYLPYEDRTGEVQAFAHGPANGVIERAGGGHYRLKVDNVQDGTYVEGRLLFPVEYLAESTNIQNIDKFKDILNEEAEYKAKIERDRQRSKAARRKFGYISLGAGLIGFLAFFLAMYECRRKVNKDILSIEYRDIPEDCTPAVTAYITYMRAADNMIFATILDLFRKGYLRIRGADEALGILENDNYVIERTDINGSLSDGPLTDHERYFMDWLFIEMGNGIKVTTDEIRDYIRHKSTQFLNSQGKWMEKVKKEADRLGYLDHGKSSLGGMLIVLSFVNLVLGVITAVLGSPYAIAGFASFTVTLVYGISLFFRLSDKGYVQRKKWISFKNYMNRIYPNLTPDSIDTSDPALIYAMALNVGASRGLAKKIGLTGLTDTLNTDSWLFWYILFGIDSDNSFNKSIRSSLVIPSSGSGGSFSGGGGGGAGGGGAGGF
ncbi:MAG: DUF2207 domain-containing protein [Clostridiales bacterium]|nr:DUF2207 domain-containing protein [Clostridiales bacterium]